MRVGRMEQKENWPATCTIMHRPSTNPGPLKAAVKCDVRTPVYHSLHTMLLRAGRGVISVTGEKSIMCLKGEPRSDHSMENSGRSSSYASSCTSVHSGAHLCTGSCTFGGNDGRFINSSEGVHQKQ